VIRLNPVEVPSLLKALLEAIDGLQNVRIGIHAARTDNLVYQPGQLSDLTERVNRFETTAFRN
jgi:hypothetical protein